MHIQFIYFFSFFNYFFFLGPHLRHMEVPRPGVQWELQLPAYAKATATPDPSRVCNLHPCSQQRRILNPLLKARDQTLNPMVPSCIRFCCAMTETPHIQFRMSLSLQKSGWAFDWDYSDSRGLLDQFGQTDLNYREHSNSWTWPVSTVS